MSVMRLHGTTLDAIRHRTDRKNCIGRNLKLHQVFPRPYTRFAEVADEWLRHLPRTGRASGELNAMIALLLGRLHLRYSTVRDLQGALSACVMGSKDMVLVRRLRELADN